MEIYLSAAASDFSYRFAHYPTAKFNEIALRTASLLGRFKTLKPETVNRFSRFSFFLSFRFFLKLNCSLPKNHSDSPFLTYWAAMEIGKEIERDLWRCCSSLANECNQFETEKMREKVQ